jgi:hypothetical protein
MNFQTKEYPDAFTETISSHKSGSVFAEADYEEWIQSFDSADRAERDSNKGQGDRGIGVDRDAAGENDSSEKRYEAKPRSNGRDADATSGEWGDPDWSLLDDRRGQLPDFPLDVLSPEIRDFLERAAHGAGVMVDHVAVPLLSIASSLLEQSSRIHTSALGLSRAPRGPPSLAIREPENTGPRCRQAGIVEYRTPAQGQDRRTQARS